MSGTRGLLLLARHEIVPGATRALVTKADVVVTLWVESGAVELMSSGDSTAVVLACFGVGGPVPLTPRELYLRNAGEHTALVFAAMAELDRGDDGGDRHAVSKDARFAFDELDAARTSFRVSCRGRDGGSACNFSVTSPSAQVAQQKADDHEDANDGHRTRVRPAS